MRSTQRKPRYITQQAQDKSAGIFLCRYTPSLVREITFFACGQLAG